MKSPQDCEHMHLEFNEEEATCMDCALQWERYSITLMNVISNTGDLFLRTSETIEQ